LNIEKVVILNLHVAPIFDLKINCSSEAHLSLTQTNFYRPELVTWTRAAHHGADHQVVTTFTTLSATELAADPHAPPRRLPYPCTRPNGAVQVFTFPSPH
jgi:hypothetical protein